MAFTMKQSARVQARAAAPARKPVLVRASAAAGEVPSPEKRGTMNLILAGGIGLPVAGLAGPVRRGDGRSRGGNGGASVFALAPCLALKNRTLTLPPAPAPPPLQNPHST